MKIKKIIFVSLMCLVVSQLNYLSNQKTKAKEKVKRIVYPALKNKRNQARLENRVFTLVDYTPTGIFLKKGDNFTIRTNQEIELWIKIYGHYRNFNNGQKNLFSQVLAPIGTTSYITATDGMLYLQNYQNVEANVEIIGGTKAPTFIKDQSSSEEWLAKVETTSSPFVELITNNLIATFKTATVKQFYKQKDQQPRITLDTWDQYVKLALQVSGVCQTNDHCNEANSEFHYQQKVHITNPDYAERTVYAYATDDHIAFPGEAGIEVLNYKYPRVFLHEIGHVFQSPQYWWEEQSEVTNEILNLYVTSRLGIPNQLKNIDIKQKAKAYLDSKRPKNHDLINEKYVKLMLFEQLRIAFGNEFLTWLNVEARNDILSGNQAKTTEEKKQALILNSSKIVNYNLGPFFEKWGFEIADKTAKIINCYRILKEKIWENGLEENYASDHFVQETPYYQIQKPKVNPCAKKEIPRGKFLLENISDYVQFLDNEYKNLIGYRVDHQNKIIVLKFSGKVTNEIFTNLVSFRQTNENVIVFLGYSNNESFYGYLDKATRTLKFIESSKDKIHEYIKFDYITITINDSTGKIVKKAAIKGIEAPSKIVEKLGEIAYDENYSINIYHHERANRLKVYINNRISSNNSTRNKKMTLKIKNNQFEILKK